MLPDIQYEYYPYQSNLLVWQEVDLKERLSIVGQAEAQPEHMAGQSVTVLQYADAYRHYNDARIYFVDLLPNFLAIDHGLIGFDCYWRVVV